MYRSFRVRGTIGLIALSMMGIGSVAGALLEMEPNDTVSQAMALRPVENFMTVFGRLAPAGDRDYFRFEVGVVSKVWVGIDTGGPQAPAATSRSTVLKLLSADGSTVIETDVGDGTANGCDSTVEEGEPSAIAGRTLAPGQYLLELTERHGAHILDPYRLWFVLTPANDQTEIEPNGVFHRATLLATSSNRTALVSGLSSSPGDLDFFAVPAEAGDILFVGADGDPERDGASVDLLIDLLSTDGMKLLLSAQAPFPSSNSPSARAFCFSITASGTYFLRVAQRAQGGQGPESYQLMVTRRRFDLFDSRLTGSVFQFRFATETNQVYAVERTTALGPESNWTVLTNIAGTGGIVTVTDPITPERPGGFYRVRLDGTE